MESRSITMSPVLNIGDTLLTQALQKVTSKEELTAVLEVLGHDKMLGLTNLLHQLSAAHLVAVMKLESIDSKLIEHTRIQMCSLMSVFEALNKQGQMGENHPLLQPEVEDEPGA